MTKPTPAIDEADAAARAGMRLRWRSRYRCGRLARPARERTLRWEGPPRSGGGLPPPATPAPGGSGAPAAPRHPHLHGKAEASAKAKPADSHE